MANPAPTINQINAFNATQGTTIDFNIIGGTELIRSNRIYIYDLSDNSLICTHLYVSTESIHELPPNTDGSIVYESGKSSADFVNGAQYYAQIQTYTDTNGTQGGSGLSVAKMFWCLGDPTLTITTIPSTISTTSYNISATYTDTSASVVSNIIQQYQFNLYSATGSLLQSSGVVVGSGTQQGTSAVYDISYNFTGLNVGSSYYVTVNVTTTQGMSVNAQSNTFTVSIDTPTLGEATVVNNACDGYISVTSNLSGEYGGSGSGEIVSFETDSENVFSKLQVELEPVQEGSGDPSPSNVRPIRGHGGVDVNVGGKNLFNPVDKETSYTKLEVIGNTIRLTAKVDSTGTGSYFTVPTRISVVAGKTVFVSVGEIIKSKETLNSAVYVSVNDENGDRIGNFNNDKAYQLPTNAKSIDVYLYADAGSGTAKIGDYIEYHNVQVEYGSTATPYEPYQQPQTITQDFNVTLTPTSTDTTPYLFKAVGDVYGDRLEDKIVGGTVAWNQLFNNYGSTRTVYNVLLTPHGNSIDAVGTVSGSTSFLALTTNFTFKRDGRKYLVRTNKDIGYWGINGYALHTPTGFIFSQNEGTDWNNGSLGIYVTDGAEVSLNNISFEIFDLTQMFGSTIADYIYSLEQAQAGAGVAWFKKLFPNDYYAYNAGELLSVGGLSAHVMRDADNSVIGNYPLDSSLTLRGIPKLDASNNLYYDGDEYTSDGKVKRKYGVSTPTTATLEEDTYYAGLLGVPCWNFNMPSDMKGYNSWDEKNAIADKIVVRKYKSGVTNCIITDATTSRFVYASSTGVTAEQARDFIRSLTFVYELATPTTETATPYTNPQIVSKYGTLEYVTNSIVPVGHKTTYLTRDIFGGYVDLISGKLVVTYGYADLGALDWIKVGVSAYPIFRASLPDAKAGAGVVGMRNAISNTYPMASRGEAMFEGTEDKVFIINTSYLGADGFVYVRDSTYTDPTTFKSAMNGVQLVYELATPQTYQLTPQQVNTLVGTNNVWSEQGNIELSYHIPITNLLVKRQDVDDVSGGWLTLYSQPITQASDMDFTFIDFLNQYGKTYKYALVPLLTQTQSGVEVEVEGGYTVSNEVQSVFDGVFIADSTGSQKCKANVGYGNVDMNQVVGSITPIGAKYPIIITNSHNQYHNGSISGTIVPDDYYFNGNLSRIDMVKKRNELEQFLTNKRVKVIKDWNGNIWLVMIVGNVSCTFNNNYGMGIVDFSTNWTEVGDPTNQQDLQATGLINVGGV